MWFSTRRCALPAPAPASSQDENSADDDQRDGGEVEAAALGGAHSIVALVDVAAQSPAATPAHTVK